MKIVLEYWDREYNSIYSKVQRTEEHEVNTDEETIELFKEFDKRNNSLRYCNGSYWMFADSKIQNRYELWYQSLDDNTKFNMFYGNGVVD